MEENELRQLLQSNREQRTRGWRCPDNVELARYVGQQLDVGKRKKFEAHVARCEPCLQTIGFLVAAEEWPVAAPIPPNLVARARDLWQTKPRWERRWRWAITTAAAACVVLFVAFIFFRSRPEQTVTSLTGDLVAQHQPTAQPITSIDSRKPEPLPIQKTKTSVTPTPAVRSETSEFTPTLQFPREGAVLKRDQINFNWKPLAGAVSYEIKVVTVEGALVYSETTTQFQLRTDTKQLSPGTYFVTVVAQMPDGRTARSRMMKFRLVE